MSTNNKPWEIRSGFKKFEWTGKLITFKTEGISKALRRHFKDAETGVSYKDFDDTLPNIFLVLGYETIRSTRTGITVGNLSLLDNEKIVHYHLAPQYCQSEETIIASLKMFFDQQPT
jgi:hypothetical protein